MFILTKINCVYFLTQAILLSGPRKIAPTDLESKPISLETAMVGMSHLDCNDHFHQCMRVWYMFTSFDLLSNKEAPLIA